ncbi:hypothetical protein llap_17127 [Limosa lapponica baueri]|uniref:ribonuclease H n=1 Tax=Limosa lapponica baueri TaxID=1758121 RepID=A0A2I0TFK0_LIMLA|nr:hypothetical protein llap_17127 [Limosa lapponica baueri]
MRKDFTHHDGELLLSWLLRCWDNGADSIDLDGREAKQLGNLAKEGGTDKAIGNKADTLSLWRRLLSAVKSRYPFKDDIDCHPSKWTSMEKADHHGLNEVTPPLSAAVPDMLELQYELASKAAKWYATVDIIANAFFSIPLAAECRPQVAFTWRGVQYTWNRLPQGWKHSPTVCHGLIQTALEEAGAPEHLQYIDDIIVRGNTAEEVFKKGKQIIEILLKAAFAVKRGKVKGPAQDIQFLGIRWQDVRRQIPMDVINKITAMSPPTNKKETQAFLGVVKLHTFQLVIDIEGNTPNIKKDIYFVKAASEVIGIEAQLLLVPQVPVLGWMFKGKVPSAHHATDATWMKQKEEVTEVTQEAETSQSLTLSKFRDVWRDYGCQPGKSGLLLAYSDAGIVGPIVRNQREEDMRKWNGKPASKLEARIHELREKIAAKKGPSKAAVAPLAVKTVEGNQQSPS